MKLDDRDIIDQPSYEPLSNAELVAHIEMYAELIYDTPLAERGQWLEDIVGPARALLARATELEDALDSILLALGADPNDIDDYLMPQAAVGIIHALTERVAELEAALTAQQWQPVTDTKPEEAAEVELLVVGYRDGGIWYYHDDNPVRGWRPPTAPDAQEATTP